jgi:hypothetical protein
VTSNPASYRLFLQHILFPVESSHATILQNSHAIMICFLSADLEFDIGHDTRTSVQMSQPLSWFVKYPSVFFLLTVVLSVAGAKWVYPPFPQYHIKGAQKQNLSITCIMRPANREMPAVKRSAPLALGYRCAYCTSEFDSKTGMDCHRRHPTSLGTPCADPENSKSMSFTARANVASSILRQHDTLGATAIPAHCMFILLLSVT